jgi:hypothetical protein
MMTRRCFAALALSLAAALTLSARADAQVVVADFEDLPAPSGPLPADGGTFPVQASGPITSYGISFNFNNPFPPFWDGFGYTQSTNTTTATYEDPSAYHLPGGGGAASANTAAGAGNYGLAFGTSDVTQPVSQRPYLDLPSGANIVNALITNSTYGALSMLNGDGFAKQFGGPSGNDPDFLLLTIHGADTAGNLNGSSVDFYLADYRFGNTGPGDMDYVVDEWTEVDLSSLAGSQRLYFSFTSTDIFDLLDTNGNVIAQYFNTPTYFAIDNITYEFAAVPEPGTFALGFLGLAGLVGWRIRARRRTETAAA